MSQLKRETTSRSSPISHPDCCGEGCIGSIFLLLSSMGFRGVQVRFFEFLPRFRPKPSPAGAGGFFPFFPSWFNNSLLPVTAHLQVCIQKHSSAPPTRVPPHPSFRADQGRQGGLYKYIYIILFFVQSIFFVFVLFLLFLTLSSECFIVLLFSPPLLPQSSLPFSEWCFLSHVGMFVLQNKKKGKKKAKK